MSNFDYSKFMSPDPLIEEIRHCLERLDIIEGEVTILRVHIKHGPQDIDTQLDLAGGMSRLRSDAAHLLERAAELALLVKRMNPLGTDELLNEVVGMTEEMLAYFDKHIISGDDIS